MVTLILMRHATTQANLEGQLVGQIESPISKKGQKEIEALYGQLQTISIDHFYTSPSERARKTVELLAKVQNKEVEIVEDFKEIHFGLFEGKSFDWIATHNKEEVEKMLKEKDAYCYPQGESLITAHKRIAKGLEALLSKSQDETLLICTHAGVIRSILSHLLVQNHSLHWHFKIDNASLTYVTLEEGFAVIEKLNDTAFL